MTESIGVHFGRIVDIMARLRGNGGCPWDREQTHASLKPYLVEEAYEVLEAIEADDETGLAEELGDLLFQVVFHAQLAHEAGRFTVTDVLHRLSEKMISRHPHVFGDAAVGSAQDALVQWEAIKQREAENRGRPRSLVDGVPRALPALLRAQRVQAKAARVNFDWPDASAAWRKVDEEIAETREALSSGDPARLEEELGDTLFSLVNVARLASVDAEDALHKAIEKFRTRFSRMEADLRTEGRSVNQVGPQELEQSWQTVKRQEQQG